MNTRWRYGRFIGGRVLVSGMAAAVVLGGSLEASTGQAPATMLPGAAPVIAQQVVEVPIGTIAFTVTERMVTEDGLTIPVDGPGFLFGTSGSALVQGAHAGGSVLLGAGEAAALTDGGAYQIEAFGGAVLTEIALQANPPDIGQAVSGPFSDIAGLRDMELRRVALDQQEQMSIESAAGAGILLVAQGTALVENPAGELVELAAGETVDLDDATPVTGLTPETVVLAVTLGDALEQGAGAPVAGGEDAPGSGSGSGTTAPRIDSDNDGLSDDEEAALGSDPNNPDSDQDGLSDGDEAHTYGSSPTSNDTDGDGLPDYNEVMQHGTDPANPDTDGDGLNDHDELGYEGADPTNYDSDGDGLNDSEEVLYGASSETADYDGDGLSDYEEAKVFGTKPYAPDSDGDGLWDFNEVTDFMTDPNNPDTDGDEYTDGDEVNDGYDPFDPNNPGLLR